MNIARVGLLGLAMCAPATPAPAAPAAAQPPYPPLAAYPAGQPGAYAPAQGAPAPQTYPPPQAYAPPPSYPPPPQAYAPPRAIAPIQAPAQPHPVAPAPLQPIVSTSPTRPLLAPLLGPVAWQAEVRAVLAEDIAALTPDNQARVRGIPMVFDPNPFEVNAYASCDEHGSPTIVSTEGLLEAIDAIAQTRATDELFGTRTYAQYLGAVIPNLASSDKASAALPLGIIPLNVAADPRRWSRAHEWFDEIVAFTFGHELSHQWLGHTGCAFGPPNPLGIFQAVLSKAGHTFVQPAENQADNEGTNTVLAAGRARAPQFRWTEEGGLALLDFFLHLEDASGQTMVAFLATHPSSHLRIPWVQISAALWHQQHPG